ncbi:NnrU family protein [Ramlibacter albus]|uniref:NnrU family protein n=1 Tax=Ramlibacter albus TaxID=2079448 RepID=A0A923M5I4_9BURK|nr:NnrU family protein [Ramlibacter albus]MBC5763765.1 NnrU family protein [Ramlibacter albus]
MALLLLGLLLFLGVHSTRIFANTWRTATVARLGELPFKGIYSVLSIAGFVLVVYGYGQSRMQMPIWDPPTWMKHVTALLMLPVFPLFVAAYVPRNALNARLKHPQILSVKLWALAHLLSNGNLADVLLFGSFLVWAVLGFRAARLRDAAALGSPHDPRSTVPAPAPASAGMTAATVVVGLIVYVVFAMVLHAMWIGVRPF